MEMRSIVVLEVPVCGSLLYDDELVVAGREYNLDEGNEFDWSGGDECLGTDNSWSYYYNREAHGFGATLTQNVMNPEWVEDAQE